MHFSHHTDKMNKFKTLLENIKEETHKTVSDLVVKMEGLEVKNIELNKELL